MNLGQKSATEISPVPLSSKFYGEFESDNQNIDLYRKTIIFGWKNEVKNRDFMGGRVPHVARSLFYGKQ